MIDTTTFSPLNYTPEDTDGSWKKHLHDQDLPDDDAVMIHYAVKCRWKVVSRRTYDHPEDGMWVGQVDLISATPHIKPLTSADLRAIDLWLQSEINRIHGA